MDRGALEFLEAAAVLQTALLIADGKLRVAALPAERLPLGANGALENPRAGVLVVDNHAVLEILVVGPGAVLEVHLLRRGVTQRSALPLAGAPLLLDCSAGTGEVRAALLRPVDGAVLELLEAAAVAQTALHSLGRNAGLRLVLAVESADCAARLIRGSPQLLCLRTDGTELRVERIARAVGIADIAVSEDARQCDLGAGLETGGSSAAGGDFDRRGGVVAPSFALPDSDLGDGVRHSGRDFARRIGAQHGHAEGACVHARCVSADDAGVEAAAAALVDGAETVDQHVVADVRPAAGFHVVVLNAAENARDLAAGIRRFAGRVVQRQGLVLLGRGDLSDDLFVCAPVLAADVVQAAIDSCALRRRFAGEGGVFDGAADRR